MWIQNQKRRQLEGISRCWVFEGKNPSCLLGRPSSQPSMVSPHMALPAKGANTSICFHQQLSEMPTDLLLFLQWERKFLFPLAAFLLISWVMLSTGLLSSLERGPSRPGLLPSQLWARVFLAVQAHCRPTVTPPPPLHSQPAALRLFAALQRENFALIAILIAAHCSSLLLFFPHFVHLIKEWDFLSLMKAAHWLPRECIIEYYLIFLQE